MMHPQTIVYRAGYLKSLSLFSLSSSRVSIHMVTVFYWQSDAQRLLHGTLVN